MAKVHPLIVLQSNEDVSCSNKHVTNSKRETLTIWMKSLVMQGNGCTAFDENGDVVYRIDNYDDKHSDEVFLMDLRGKVLFTLRERKVGPFKSWKGYAADGGEKATFRVRKSGGGSSGNSYKVTMGSDGGLYRMESLGKGKSLVALRISDGNGRVVAEGKRKRSCGGGVKLGDDVLSLVVEADADRSFVMALVTVHGLIKGQL